MRARWVIWPALTGLATFLLVPASIRAEESSLLDQVVTAYEEVVRNIVSYDVSCTFEEEALLVWNAPKEYREMSREARNALRMEFLKPTGSDVIPQTSRSRQFLSGERMRVECFKNLEGEFADGQRLYVWDDKLARSYNARDKTGEIEARATSFDLMGPLTVSYNLLYRAAFGDYDYPRFVRERGATCTEQGRKYVIDAPPDPLKPIFLGVYGLRMVVDAEKNYMPESLEFSTMEGGQRIVKTVIQNTLEEVQPGLWMPMAATFTFHVGVQRSPQFGQVCNVAHFLVDEERSRFNVPLDEAMFAVTYPAGTRIADRARAVNFLVGSESQVETLDDLAAEGRLGAESLSPPIASRSRSSAFVTLVIVNVCLLAVIAAGACWRWWRA